MPETRLQTIGQIIGELEALRQLPPVNPPPVSITRSPIPSAGGVRQPVDLVIAPNEISMAHGTGVLLTRMLDDAGAFVTIRSFNHWGGKQAVSPVADILLPTLGEHQPKRSLIADFVTEALRQFEVRRILSVPYFHEDVLATLVAKAATGAPLATYIMDDHTIFHPAIPHKDMAELLQASDARFAISPEMRTAYQNTFRQKFLVQPPVVGDKFVRMQPSKPSNTSGGTIDAVMIGNIWHQNWLTKLWGAFRGTPLKVTWFASNEEHHWLTIPDEALTSGQFVIKPGVSTADMIAAVEQAALAIVPSGTSDETGHQFAIAKLSLPSRMPFIVAATGTPILVLGDEDSGAARFVKRFGVGAVSGYDSIQVGKTAADLAKRERQEEIRERAFEVGKIFRASGTYDLLAKTAEAGGDLPDGDFEKLFVIQPGDFGYYIPESVGPDVIPDQIDMVRAFRRLKTLGFTPDAVLDIGASSGIWSYTLSSVYPDARYVLVDPLFSRYPSKNLRDAFEVIECAIAEKSGKLKLQVSNDLYNSSLVAVGSVATTVEEFEVEIKTVDEVVAEKQVKGRIVLKLDVQFAEHLALEGAVKALAQQVDVVMLELTLERLAPQAKVFREMLELMSGYGFDYFDEVGEWRHPGTGRLEQKDVLFVRKGLLGPSQAA